MNRAIEAAGVVCGAITAIALVYDALARPKSWLRRGLASYTHFLERRFQSLFMQANVRAVMIAQGIVIYLVLAMAAATRTPAFALVAVLLAVVPVGYLELKHRRRVIAIEAQTDGFVLALANALKSTPSVADAFLSVKDVVPEPLRSEIDLATKHIRMGCTLEEALLSMASRVGSRVLDTALASVLIGQRVGGNLPRILETSAAALRELNRLEAMVRAKTASGRIQMWVISLAPIAFVLFFDRTEPGFFDPLTTTRTGLIILGAAISCWVVAVVLGRKILRVDV